MDKIDNILSNIKSIAFFLAKEKDILVNSEIHKISINKEIDSDIVDLKLNALQYYLDNLKSELLDMKNMTKNIINLFVASSSSLKEEREAIESFLFRLNDSLIEKGIYIKYNVWEKASLRFAITDKQEDFNRELVNESEIFICLIGTDVGKFTKEEFELAIKRFKDGEKPFILYVYFKNYTDVNAMKMFIDKPGWANRINLLSSINTELKQVSGEFDNKHELIQKISDHIEKDIDIILKRLDTTQIL